MLITSLASYLYNTGAIIKSNLNQRLSQSNQPQALTRILAPNRLRENSAPTTRTTTTTTTNHLNKQTWPKLRSELSKLLFQIQRGKVGENQTQEFICKKITRKKSVQTARLDFHIAIRLNVSPRPCVCSDAFFTLIIMSGSDRIRTTDTSALMLLYKGKSSLWP